MMKFLKLLRHQPPPDGERAARTRMSALYGGMGEREMQLRMELILEDFIADRNYQVFDTARRLAAFSLSEQDRFLKAAEQLARHSPKLAHRFCLDGIAAMTSMSGAEWDEWLATIESRLRDKGEPAAIEYLKNLDAHLQMIALPQHAVTLAAIAPVIERLITALGGRRLAVQAGEETFTDTARIYLPKICSVFHDTGKNFSFYKTTAVFLWAQTRFGTWRIDIPRLLYDSPDSDKAVALFQALENLRLDACIERELPGIARNIAELGRQSDRLPDDEAWRHAAQKLAQPGATSQDSLEMVATLYRAPQPRATAYQGVFKPVLVMREMNKRIAAERAALQEEMSEIAARFDTAGHKATLALKVDRGAADAYNFELSSEGEAVEITPEIERLLESVMQDFGEVPEDYLRLGDDGKPATAEEEQTAREDDATALLPEWDHSIRQYRPDWCHTFLREVSAGDRGFAAKTLLRHGGLVKRLRRTFEALREGDSRHRHDSDGDDIDLDAAVETVVAMRRGEEPDPRTYIRHRKTARSIAVMFVVDMSGSTGGWVNETEKEALVLLCESLETLGDRYAIYGFSGRTRERCDIFRIKSFGESYGDEVKRRIDGITAQDYTRMGAAIRFVRNELLQTDARTRIMITISDGRPDDRDGYRGQYGIEDTRRALLEASFRGIHPYCITIDTAAASYLPYMYGRANFSIVDRVEKLPFQVSDIYRRITT